MDFQHTILTNGSGYWSEVVKDVKVTHIEVPYIADGNDFGELRVYFSISDWDVHTDGLIYTDNKFETVLKQFLTMHGLESDDVNYSEQGMQGDNYVSLDVGEDFIKRWIALNGVQA